MKSPIYEFGPFVLEPHARRLSRNGESVQLAAPEFELLLLLVNNQGRVVEKSEIMDAVWPDAAVEENNLTVRMSSLRRALGETKGNHPYIQTVTGRGYCLIVPVKTVETEVTGEQAVTSESPVVHPSETPVAVAPATTRRRWEMRGTRLYAFVMVVVLALSALSAVLLRKRGDKTAAATQSMKLTRLTHTGRVMAAGMSFDGQNIAYVERYNEMSSLWLQRAGTNAPLQLLPPAKAFLRDPSFSRDGNTVYYTKCESSCLVYKMPVLGGVETAMGFRSDGRLTFSPDGKRMAYVRGTVDETGGVIVNVFVANVNGTGEKALNWQGGGSSYQGGAPAWSPDGKVIAVSMLLKEGNRSYYNVIGLGVDDGTNSTLISQWRSIRDVHWLPDSSGFIINGLNTGSEDPGCRSGTCR